MDFDCSALRFGKIISERMLMEILNDIMFLMFFIGMTGLKYRNKISVHLQLYKRKISITRLYT